MSTCEKIKKKKKSVIEMISLSVQFPEPKNDVGMLVQKREAKQKKSQPMVLWKVTMVTNYSTYVIFSTTLPFCESIHTRFSCKSLRFYFGGGGGREKMGLLILMFIKSNYASSVGYILVMY